MLLRQIERISGAKRIDKLIVATSTDPSDDPIEKLCLDNHILLSRGSLQDVLDRFFRAASAYQAGHIVRLTGDCPLADPEVIDSLIEFYLHGGYDYASNSLEPTLPDGLDAEIFRFACLKLAWEEAKLPSQREHVTPFIHSQPELFKLGSYKNSVDLSTLRWTVDEKEDFELISRIYAELYPLNPRFTMNDVLLFLEREPELKKHNVRYARNEGFQKSLQKDKELCN